MPIGRLHKRVARVALEVAGRHGFALGGGNALIAHGFGSRPTEDVDLFTNREGGVRAAVPDIEAGLRKAGFTVVRRDGLDELADLIPGADDGLAEWMVTDPDGAATLLQVAQFDRARGVVGMDFGPVLDIEDVLGGKVCALAGRGEVRDYVDVAAALEQFTAAQLIGFARRLDAGLEDRDFAEAGRFLDHVPDDQFARYGLDAAAVRVLRKKMAAWPR